MLLKCLTYSWKLLGSSQVGLWGLESIFSSFVALFEWVFWLSWCCAWVQGSTRMNSSDSVLSAVFTLVQPVNEEGETETPSPKHVLLQWWRPLYSIGSRGLLAAAWKDGSALSFSSHNAPRLSGGWYPGSWGSNGSLERRILIEGTVLCTAICVAVPSALSHTSFTTLYCSLVSWCKEPTLRFIISAQVIVFVTARPDPVKTTCLRPPQLAPLSPCIRAIANPIRLRILLPSFTRISNTPDSSPGKGQGLLSSVRQTFLNPSCPSLSAWGATGNSFSGLEMLFAPVGWPTLQCNWLW